MIDDFNREGLGIEADLSLPSARVIRIDYIQPDKPQQNAYVERFNRTVRYDWLSQTLFSSIKEVQDTATR